MTRSSQPKSLEIEREYPWHALDPSAGNLKTGVNLLVRTTLISAQQRMSVEMETAFRVGLWGTQHKHGAWLNGLQSVILFSTKHTQNPHFTS